MILAAARPLVASGAAVLAAGALAVAPLPDVAPPAPPAVHVAEVALAGIGQDIYYAITPVVQYAVGGVSYLINFIPLIGGPIAAQININYFQLIQPVIEATVNYAASIVQNPLNIIASTQNYGSTLYDISYNYVSAQLQFIGLNPLPPLPPRAASNRAPKAPAPAAARGEIASGATTLTPRSARSADTVRARDSAALRPARAAAVRSAAAARSDSNLTSARDARAGARR